MWSVGSRQYVDSVFNCRDSILGVINLDMIAYDSNADYKMTIVTDTNSNHFADFLFKVSSLYQPRLSPFKLLSGGSDHVSFWEKGYVATMLIEDHGDFNIYYHRVEDNYEHTNKLYEHSIIKLATAAMYILGSDLFIHISHEPLMSTLDTSSRVVSAVIKSSYPIASYSNGPRLYFKTYSSSFSYVNAFYVSQDTFKFIIPGFPVGTRVEYYIAAQDSASNVVSSLPEGSLGMNPPGTIPPLNFFRYQIMQKIRICSSNLPKIVQPLGFLYDSIYIGIDKLVGDLDVSVSITHSNDSDLYIMLNRSQLGQTNMSQHNGHTGDDYINTTFDDEADTLITDGTPPFTGHYRPEYSLERYDNTSTLGIWVLKLLNLSETITGRLDEWCIDISYFNPIGISNLQTALSFILCQNYPNPFNAATRISYEIPKQGRVKLVIYDILGRELSVLVNDEHKPGKYEAVWNANNYASGIYFYRLVCNDFVDSKKMVLIK